MRCAFAFCPEEATRTVAADNDALRARAHVVTEEDELGLCDKHYAALRHGRRPDD